MAKSLEMFFDPDTNAAIEELWARLERGGVSSLATFSHRRHRPHVTLAVADTLPITAAVLDAIGASRGMQVRMHGLGVFPGTDAVLFLGITAASSLLNAHAEVHRAIGDCPHPWEHYLPGAWVPHLTLSMNLDGAALSRAIALLYPFTVRQAVIAQVGLVDVGTGDVIPLDLASS